MNFGIKRGLGPQSEPMFQGWTFFAVCPSGSGLGPTVEVITILSAFWNKTFGTLAAKATRRCSFPICELTLCKAIELTMQSWQSLLMFGWTAAVLCSNSAAQELPATEESGLAVSSNLVVKNFSVDQITPASMDEISRAAGAYLARMVNAEGMFVYRYHADSDFEEPSYNIIRHAGTAFAMMEYFAYSGDETVKGASQRALDRLLKFGQPSMKSGDKAIWIVEDMNYRLGANALTLLALAQWTEATGDRSYMDSMHLIAEGIIECLRDDGWFVCNIRMLDGIESDIGSEYFPGEAIFALTRLYQLDPNPRWLEAAKKGAAHQIHIRDRGKTPAELPHDHWLMYSLNELHRLDPQPMYKEHAYKLAEAMILGQRRDPDPPEYVGGYKDPPRCTATATHSEGLMAVYAIAVREGDIDVQAKTIEAAKLAIAFQCRSFIDAKRSEHYPNPRRALGGFTESPEVHVVQIDGVQHNLSSLLAMHRALVRLEKKRDLPAADR
jgi:hypothetical protein